MFFFGVRGRTEGVRGVSRSGGKGRHTHERMSGEERRISAGNEVQNALSVR